MLLLMAITVSLLFLLILSLLLYLRSNRHKNLFYRLRRYRTEDARVTASQTTLQRLAAILTEITRPFAGMIIVQTMDDKVRQAGIPLLGMEFLIFVAGSAAFTALLAGLLFLNLSIAFFSGILTILLWQGILQILIRRRANLFTEQLGDCLVTVSNALRAGNSLQKTLSLVAQKMSAPIGEEFAIVERDLDMGILLEDALYGMSRRVASPDFELVVTAIVIQREVGGNLAQILDNISDTINDRIRMKREIYALTAQGRFSALVLLLLPVAVLFFMYIIDPEQAMLLLNEKSGNITLAVAFVLEIIGFVFIKRIIDIKM